MILVEICYFLLIFTATAHFYHYFLWQPRLRRELYELNKRRAERVRDALATAPDATDDTPAPHSHPFAAWIQLREDGMIQCASELFRHTDRFQLIARDARNLPRASARCDGLEVVINSHGQTFVARFTDGHWDVQTATNPPT